MGQDVLKVEVKDDGNDGKKGGQGDVKGDADTAEHDNGPTSLRVWISLVEAVSELTRYDFEKVYSIPVVEFFTYVSYIKWREKKREQDLKKINKKYAK